MNFPKLDEIISLDSSIRYVGIIDSRGNTIDRRTREDQKDDPDGEEYLHIDAIISRQIADIQQEKFGKTVSVLTIRKKIYEFILYTDHLIVYVTFDPDTLSKVSQIAEKIEPIVKEMLAIVH